MNYIANPSRLDVPNWVPADVAGVARMILTNGLVTTPDENVVQRLLSDERMKVVWEEFNKHQRENHKSTDRFVHHPTLPRAIESWEDMSAAINTRAAEARALGSEEMASAYDKLAAATQLRHQQFPPESISGERRRGIGLATIFALAVSSYCRRLESVARSDLEQLNQKLRAEGKQDIAQAYTRAARGRENARFIVDRKRTDPRINAFIEGLALRMKEMFKKEMWSIIAIITNVAFERSDFTRSRVRAILKGRAKADRRRQNKPAKPLFRIPV